MLLPVAFSIFIPSITVGVCKYNTGLRNPYCPTPNTILPIFYTPTAFSPSNLYAT